MSCAGSDWFETACVDSIPELARCRARPSAEHVPCTAETHPQIALPCALLQSGCNNDQAPESDNQLNRRSCGCLSQFSLSVFLLSRCDFGITDSWDAA